MNQIFACTSVLRLYGRATPLCLQVSGTFQCMDCQAMIKDVPQQFKYSPPTICRNPVCNNRARFHLDTHKSKFIDFQKVAAIRMCLTCRRRIKRRTGSFLK